MSSADSAPAASDLLRRRDGAVLHLTINRPSRRNALDLGLYRAVITALADATADASVHVVTLRGAGGHFTAGNDIADFIANPPLTQDHVIYEFLLAVVGFTKPLLAGVDGVAVGVGTTLLLHCDIVIATPRTRFAVPFVQLGLTPEAASSVLLPATVGLQRASRWLLLGEPFTGEEAHAAGLVSQLTTPERLDEDLDAVAARLAALPPAAVQASRELLHRPRRDATLRALQEEAVVFQERLRSPEATAAFQTFLSRGRAS
jgi:enoyl-CoA hydratase/carnithine racemase